MNPSSINGLNLYSYANNNPIRIDNSYLSVGESNFNTLINQSFNSLMIHNLGLIENKSYSSIHWKNEWFATCAGHGINLASESLVTGIYHQV